MVGDSSKYSHQLEPVLENVTAVHTMATFCSKAQKTYSTLLNFFDYTDLTVKSQKGI